MTLYYIRKSGNDLYTGLSGSGAWLTIGKANSTLNAGDTVYIGAGDYSSESIDPTNDGSSGSILTYYGDKLGVYTDDAGNIQAKDFYLDKDHMVIRGIDFVYTCILGKSGHQPEEVKIDACSMPRLRIRLPDNTRVWNCMIGPSGSSVVPLDVLEANKDIYIYHNTIIGPSSFVNGAQAATKGVLSVQTNGEVYVKNNIVVANCDMKLIWLDTFDTKNHVDYNRYHSSSYGTFFGRWWDIGGYHQESTFENWQTNSGQDANSSVGDPGFVGGDNYHILDSSPCVGAATSVGVDHDYDYDSRSSDIGADEVILNVNQQTILSDANVLIEDVQQTILSDANVLIEDVQQIILSDADIVIEDVQQALLSDANVYGEVQQLILSDANAFVEDNQQTILSDAHMIPATSSDPFSFDVITKEVSSFSLKTEDESKKVLVDAKLKHNCDHNLPSGKYSLNACPRCLGKGHYFDIKFSPGGDIFLVNETEKLLQELVKITLTSKGTNPFHGEYGSYVSDSVGKLQVKEFREGRLKQSIMDAVLRLRYLQREGVERGYKFSLKELIDKVKSIEIYEIAGNPTYLGFKVKVVSVEGTTAILQGSVSL